MLKLNKMDISAVIFDMDGLMFDTERLAIEAWQYAGRVCECNIPESLIIQTIGQNVHDTRHLFEMTLGTSLDFDRARALRVQYADDFIEQKGVPFKNGLVELLDKLEQYKLPKAIATSTERIRAEKVLKKAQLLTRFNTIIYGDEVLQGKPAPDIFLLTAKRLRVNTNQCLVLEDSENGIQAAANANMNPWMIPDIKPPSAEMLKLSEKTFPNLYSVTAYLSDILPAN